jgi:hypothetical protein
LRLELERAPHIDTDALAVNIAGYLSDDWLVEDFPKRVKRADRWATDKNFANLKPMRNMRPPGSSPDVIVIEAA